LSIFDEIPKFKKSFGAQIFVQKSQVATRNHDKRNGVIVNSQYVSDGKQTQSLPKSIPALKPK